MIAIIFFLLGLYAGPKIITVEVPQIHIVESCKGAQVQVVCPKDDSARASLALCIGSLKGFVEKIESAKDELSNCQQSILSEKAETEYFRKRYMDYTCD